MESPVIREGLPRPHGDGDIGLYAADETQGAGWFDRTRRVVFVNGMGNTPDDHARSARALSVLQACPVIGVYNRSNGFWSDLGQCISDKATLAGVQAGFMRSYADWLAEADRQFDRARQRRPGLDRLAFFADLVAGNPATRALYALVATMAPGDRAGLKIFCHSQGNLVTSNALTAVAMALGAASIRGLEVNSYGSPCRYWPEGLSRTNNAFTFDPVSLLDLRADLTSVKVGFKVAHGFDVYLRNDAEFVVNRFRWGSLGLTASMDEAGLAAFMVGIGNNPGRLKPILERLRDAHWTDSDDVALAYVQAAPDALLKALKLSDASIITLLVAMLDSGWTSADERAAIARLQGI
jgi:hypothetical protein